MVDVDEEVWDNEVQAFFDDFKWDETDISNGLDTSLISIAHEGGVSYSHVMADLFSKEKRRVPTKLHLEQKPFPRNSSLTISEMGDFLRLDKRFSGVTYDKDSKFALYKKLLTHVREEQEEYQSYLFQCALEKKYEYNFVDPLVQQYIDARMELGKARVKAYQQNYISHSKIRISVVPFKTDVYPHALEGNEVHLGNQSMLPMSHPLPMNLNNKFMRDVGERTNQTSMWRKCFISCDTNAEKLASYWEADIVLSMASLYTLTDNQQPFPLEWEIPFTVKTLEDENGNSRNVVFIDSPLPPKSFLPKEKNVLYYRKAIKLAFGCTNNTLADIRSQVDQLKNKPKTNSVVPVSAAPPQTKNESLVSKVKPQKAVHSTSSDEFSHSEEENLPQLDGANDAKNILPVPRLRRPKRSTSGYKFKRKVKKPKQEVDSAAATVSNKTADEKENVLDETTTSANNAAIQSGKVNETKIIENDSSDEPMLSIDMEVQSTSQIEEHTDDPVVLPSIKSPKAMSSTQANKWKSSFIKDKPKDGAFPSLDASIFQAYKRRPSSDKQKSATKTTTASKVSLLPSLAVTSEPYQLSMKPSEISLPNLNFTSSNFLSSTKLSDPIRSNTENLTMDPDIQMPTPLSPIKSNKNTSRKRKMVVQDSTDDSDNNLTIATATDESNDEANHKTVNTDNLNQRNKSPTQSAAASMKTELKLNMWTTNEPTKTPAKNTPKASEHKKTEELKDIKPFIPNNDLLGQILGIKTNKTTDNAQDKTDNPWTKTAQEMWRGDKSVNDDTEAESEKLADKLDLLKPRGKCSVSYVLWKFGNKRVLIRYYVEGKAIPPNQIMPFPISVHTKLDYQLPLVFDQLSTSEVCRDWLALLVKKSSWLVRARVDPVAKKLVEREWVKDINKLLSTNQGNCLTHTTNMKMVTTIFKNLSELGRGNYLCTHKTKDSFVEIREAVEVTFKRVIYDLHNAYQNPGQTLESNIIPWLPGDPITPCAYHRARQLIPLMFHPKSEQEFHKDSAKQKPKRRKKKKK